MCSTQKKQSILVVRLHQRLRACLPENQHLSTPSTPWPASSHWISSGFHQQGTGSPFGERGDRRIYSTWRNLNVPSQHESPTALEPLLITITTLPKPTIAPISDLDIEITSEEGEESFAPTPEHYGHWRKHSHKVHWIEGWTLRWLLWRKWRCHTLAPCHEGILPDEQIDLQWWEKCGVSNAQ